MFGERKVRFGWSVSMVIVPLYMFAIVHLGIHWWLAWRTFVVNADTSDDALMTFIDQPQWLTGVSVVTFSLMALIADFVTVSNSTTISRPCNRWPLRSGGAGRFGIVTGK